MDPQQRSATLRVNHEPSVAVPIAVVCIVCAAVIGVTSRLLADAWRTWLVLLAAFGVGCAALLVRAALRWPVDVTVDAMGVTLRYVHRRRSIEAKRLQGFELGVRHYVYTRGSKIGGATARRRLARVATVLSVETDTETLRFTTVPQEQAEAWVALARDLHGAQEARTAPSRTRELPPVRSGGSPLFAVAVVGVALLLLAPFAVTLPVMLSDRAVESASFEEVSADLAGFRGPRSGPSDVASDVAADRCTTHSFGLEVWAKPEAWQLRVEVSRRVDRSDASDDLWEVAAIDSLAVNGVDELGGNVRAHATTRLMGGERVVSLWTGCVRASADERRALTDAMQHIANRVHAIEVVELRT